MAPHRRSQKLLELPSIVVAAKAFLEQKNSKSLSVMKKLTESRNAELQEALIRMWLSLENSIKKQPEEPGYPNDKWPHFFVGYVRMYSSLPPYYYQPKSERKKLVTDIKKHISGLDKLLKNNGFNHHLAYAESRNSLHFLERMGFIDNFKAEQSLLEKPAISEILNRLQNAIEAEISPLRQTKRDSFEKARLFVYKLAQYLQDVHGEASNVVLMTATKAIMDVEYTEVDIHHILERHGFGKTHRK
jgi:hypothetical protein